MTTLLWCLPFAAALTGAQDAPRPVRAVRLDRQPVVDGRLDEKIWGTYEGVTGFVQRDPNERTAPTESTVVYIAYDDAALYVGARLYDRAPQAIVARLGRRDVATTSDRFVVYLDPYHDGRSGFYFGVNAAGTLDDGVLYNDDWNDGSWDGVWDARTRIDEQGWTVEMRIPYSQLRFHQAETFVWGVNFMREIARKNEVDYYVLRPKAESGFVSRFADLVGIERIAPPRRLELTPYATARAGFTRPEAGDPFDDGSSYDPGGGLDVRAGIGNNLTLNLTVNPDFGQVEVDPAVVNLSDVETFFEEKRPFFVEGSSIFDYGFGGATDYWNFNWPAPRLFYTRRLGRAPQAELPDADFSDVPEGANIAGAVKLTGKVGGSWNLGTLGAVTTPEHAQFDTSGVRWSKEVEPRAYYGIVRAQKEFRQGRRGLGTMATLTLRDFGDAALRDELPRDALLAGVDGWTFLDKSKEWVVTGWAAASRVGGTAAGITALQENAVHYFQRPDASPVRVDSGATALGGWAARFHVNKQRGDWFSNSGLGFISPGFESNDLGFQPRAGVINMHAGAGRAWRRPGRVVRQANLGAALFQSYNWDGDVTWRGVWGLAFVQFLSYWSLEFSGAYNPPTFSDRLTRGGPLMPNASGFEVNVETNSDTRDRLVLGTRSGVYYQSRSDYDAWAGFTLDYRVVPNVLVSVAPRVSWNLEPAQYVTTYADPTAGATFGHRYVFADLSYREVSAGIRMNWTLSPALSLQVYAQPLRSRGAYRRFKALAQPRTFTFGEYGQGGSAIQDSSTFYVVDADGTGPAPSERFDDPDIDVRSLRGNAVLRWEFLPGSTFYLVWTQRRSASEGSKNIFLLKATYWWNP